MLEVFTHVGDFDTSFFSFLRFITRLSTEAN